ncbi:MAG: hypothetical protein ABSC53_05255 [Bacteroidota bacterium]
MTRNFYKIPPKLTVEERKRLAELYEIFRREQESALRQDEEEQEDKDYSER